MTTAMDVSLDTLDMSDASRFADNTMWPLFERLRAEAPVHLCPDSQFGPYWSVTRHADIMAVEMNHEVFSSRGGITLSDPRSEELRTPMFIAMDPPKHGDQRKAVNPIVAPANLANMDASSAAAPSK